MNVDYIPERLMEIYRGVTNSFEELCHVVRREYEILIDIDADERHAYLTLIPPTVESAPLTLEQMKGALRHSGVLFGVQDSFLLQIIQEKIENEPVLVAYAQNPIEGTDGFLEIAADLDDPSSSPQRVVPGYQGASLFHRIVAGGRAARLVYPTLGTDGSLVTGRLIESRRGRTFQLSVGKNIRYSPADDGWIALTEGYLFLSEETLSVELILEQEQMDASKGPIDFEGVVIIRGDVGPHCSIHASARIEVGGNVTKSNLTTEGSIAISQKVSHSTLLAKKSIYAGTLQHSSVETEQHLIVQTHIFQSQVDAQGIVYVVQKEGFIEGGLTNAGCFVWTPSLGSKQSHEKTRIQIGLPLQTRLAQTLEDDLLKKMVLFEKTKKKITGLLAESSSTLSDEWISLIHHIRHQTLELHRQLQQDFLYWESIKKKQDQMEDSKGGMLFVPGTLNPGTSIKIQKLSFTNEQLLSEVGLAAVNDRLQVTEIFKKIPQYQTYFQQILQDVCPNPGPASPLHSSKRESYETDFNHSRCQGGTPSRCGTCDGPSE